MAGELWFYHVEHSTLDVALGRLLEKCLERGWRALVVAGEDRLAQVDAGLWTFRQDSFLPHGRVGPDATRQPILLSQTPDPLNGAQVAVLLDGASADPDRFERCMVIFDGADAAARQSARDTYRDARAAGRTVRYFLQSASGAWAEQGANPAPKS